MACGSAALCNFTSVQSGPLLSMMESLHGSIIRVKCACVIWDCQCPEDKVVPCPCRLALLTVSARYQDSSQFWSA